MDERHAGARQAAGWVSVVCGWLLLATVLCTLSQPYLTREYFNVGLERMWQDLDNSHWAPTFRAECFGPANHCK